MKINSEKAIIIEVRDIERAFMEKYNRDIEAANVLFGDNYYNDCFKSLNIHDARADAIWDIKVENGLISDEMEEDEIAKEYNNMEIDLDKIPDGDNKDIILICDLLRECGIMDERVLIDVSW